MRLVQKSALQYLLDMCVPLLAYNKNIHVITPDV
jgi:hypothetical protein